MVAKLILTNGLNFMIITSGRDFMNMIVVKTQHLYPDRNKNY